MNFEQKPNHHPIEEQPKEKVFAPELPPEKEGFLCAELLEISEEELTFLKSRIKDNQGHVQINMHPLYGRHHRVGLDVLELGVQREEGKRTKLQAAAEEGFLRIATHVAKQPNSSPLFVFEEEAFMVDTRGYVADQLSIPVEELASRGIFFVPTLYDAGVVSYEQATRVYDHAQDTHSHETYQKLVHLEQDILAKTRVEVMGIAKTARTREELDTKQAAFLAQVVPIMEQVKKNLTSFQSLSEQVLYYLVHGLEISSVNLSGGFFRKETKEKKDYYLIAGGCAGYLRNMLRRYDIKVNLSKYIAPKRESIGKLDPITKDTRDL
jgi:23S rRNA pseudoU1915 N3-methylase RlmH